ncbi:thiazole tautomerase TenI [Sediminibacillus halophilus]|uniref:Thiamine-phosphate synthase n=1 Tax=Sediminibacillus halophilus TaxID=482461 RepID=A0A1G9WFA5_9BACI|nr:thiazole tautomerase TenI [Sediminibacillus halophilus]SDM82715.1 thiazole tautomerase (transcriptional regulator TenI) [Sediminibacillus halophilus]
MRNGELHIVSTGNQQPEEFAKIAGDIHPYITAIHIREKHKTAKEIYQMIKRLLDNQVPASKIIVNDRLDVAHVMKVCGVHLAYHSLPVDEVKERFPDLRVGCSVHSLEEATLAQKQGADYAFFGHVFPTKSKPGLAPRGVEQLRSILSSVSIPVIAIGGIKPGNVNEVMEAGAKGVAVMSGVLEANQPLVKAKEYVSELII